MFCICLYVILKEHLPWQIVNKEVGTADADD